MPVDKYPVMPEDQYGFGQAQAVRMSTAAHNCFKRQFFASGKRLAGCLHGDSRVFARGDIHYFACSRRNAGDVFENTQTDAPTGVQGLGRTFCFKKVDTGGEVFPLGTVNFIVAPNF